MTKVILLILSVGLSFATLAQSGTPQSYDINPHSIKNISPQDIMFKKSLWFRVDLRTRSNGGLFAKDREISKFLIEAVQDGKITPFKDDQMNQRLTKEEFMKGLQISQTSREEDLGLMDEFSSNWGDEAPTTEKKNEVTFPKEQDYYFPDQLYIIELKMDRIFDRRKSQMFNDLTAISLVLPAEMNPIGVDKVVATFSYKELYEQVFKVKDPETGALRDNPETIWYNAQNPAFNHNLADAFELGLWKGTLVKYENPKDNMIVEMYGEGRNSRIMSERAVYDLMEYEATLWSY